MPRLRMIADIPPLPLYVFMAWKWETLPLPGSIYPLVKWPRLEGNHFYVVMSYRHMAMPPSLHATSWPGS
jgi:hypothetical protein